MRPHHRILLLGGVWLVLGGVVSAEFYSRLREVRSRVERLAHDELSIVLEMAELRDAMTRSQLISRHLVTEEDPAVIARERMNLGADLRVVRSRLTRLGDAGVGVGLEESLVACGEAVRGWVSATEDYFGQAARVEGEPALAAVSERFIRAMEQLDNVSRELMPLMNERAAEVGGIIASTQRRVVTLIGTGVAAGCALTGLVAMSVRRQQRARERAQSKQEFEGRVTEALGMAENEDGALRLVEEVLERVRPGIAAEVLLADSSRAHVFQAAATSAVPEGEAMCGVKSPSQCPAVRRGYELTFPSSEEFDACPYLRCRSGDACAATCVPLSVMGQHVGVLHVVTARDERLSPDSASRVMAIAAKAGERIGVIRAFNRSEDQATKDTLTGLLNRRSAEQKVQDLQRADTRFCVAYADIDHFKKLNDTHGHETGDRSLRFFSRLLADTLRPTDVVARWGGEEFVILLPRLELEQARATLERLRETVEQATGQGTVPKFTVSFGVTECLPGDEFSARLNEADAALLIAKREGRNRVMVAGAPTLAGSQGASEHPGAALAA